MKLSITIDSSFYYDDKLVENLLIEDETEIIIKYISDFRATKLLRDFLLQISEKFQINNIWKKRLVLIIDELNNNAIEYGTKSGDYNFLKIFAKKIENKIFLRIEVEDAGNLKNHKTAEEMIELREKRKKRGFKEHNSIRGRGLFMIIDKLVDNLYFKNSEKGGLIVGIEKEIEL